MSVTPPDPDRPYQVAGKDAVLRVWEGQAEGDERRVGALIVMATGLGKTRLGLSIVAPLARSGKRVLWLAHRKELLEQALRALQRNHPGVRGGIVQAARNEADCPVVFASIQTLVRQQRRDRLVQRGRFDVVVVDEAHHSAAKTHARVLEELAGGHAYRLGLSATPDRDDGLDLGEQWEIAYSYGISEGIGGGYLVPPYAVVDRLSAFNLEKIALQSSGRRDYDPAELGRELLVAGIVEHTVAAMEKTHLARRLPDRAESAYLTCKGRRCLVFTATVEQAIATSDALRKAGWRSRWVSGDTPEADRSALTRAFERGDLDVLVNCAIFTEGTDFPSVGAIVLARPTRSWSLLVQCLGRGLRLYENKRECLVLDLGGATEAHDIRFAPVLLGGEPCPTSPNRAHDYQPVDRSEKGRCVHCLAEVACFVAVQHGGDGGHVWEDAEDGWRRCKHCARPQCQGPDEEKGRHAWVPQAGGKRICLHCGVEITEALASMVGPGGNNEATATADWVRVRGVEPETYVVDVDPYGLLFVTGSRETATWSPIWVKSGARAARPLSDGPVPKELVRPMADDIVRRSARKGRQMGGNGRPTQQQIEAGRNYYGVDVSACSSSYEASLLMLQTRARERAVALGIARPEADAKGESSEAKKTENKAPEGAREAA